MIRKNAIKGLILCIGAVSCMFFIYPISIAQQPDFQVPSGVQVQQNTDTWIIEGKTRQIAIRKSDLQIGITTPAARWQMLPAGKNDLNIKDSTAIEKISLLDAQKMDFSEYRNGFQHGVQISLDSFHSGDTAFDIKLALFICLKGNAEDLVFRITAIEGKTTFRELAWPKGFSPESFDNTVVPFMQGMLLPKNWDRKVWLYDTLTYGRGFIYALVGTSTKRICGFGSARNRPGCRLPFRTPGRRTYQNRTALGAFPRSFLLYQASPVLLYGQGKLCGFGQTLPAIYD